MSYTYIEDGLIGEAIQDVLPRARLGSNDRLMCRGLKLRQLLGRYNKSEAVRWTAEAASSRPPKSVPISPIHDT